MANSSFSGVKPEPACPVHLFCFQTQCTEHQLHLYITKAKGECAKDEEMVDVGWFLLGIWWIRFVIPEIGYFWVSIRNWIYAKKLHQKIKKSHVQRINIYCLFRNDFGYTRKKKQFRVIIPESVTNLGGGEEPKNVPSNFGVLQFYIILALALLTILSENFGFSVRRRLSWEMLPK